jgi:hypothetical protein
MVQIILIYKDILSVIMSTIVNYQNVGECFLQLLSILLLSPENDFSMGIRDIGGGIIGQIFHTENASIHVFDENGKEFEQPSFVILEFRVGDNTTISIRDRSILLTIRNGNLPECTNREEWIKCSKKLTRHVSKNLIKWFRNNTLENPKNLLPDLIKKNLEYIANYVSRRYYGIMWWDDLN